MAKTKIIVLEGNKERKASLTNILGGPGKCEVMTSDNLRELLNHMDGRGEAKVVITNTNISRDEQDGISKEDFEKWAPEIHDDITFTFEALGEA